MKVEKIYYYCSKGNPHILLQENNLPTSVTVQYCEWISRVTVVSNAQKDPKCILTHDSSFLCKVLQAFQAKALEINEKVNAVVEFLEDALARAKYLVTFSRKVITKMEDNLVRVRSLCIKEKNKNTRYTF